MRHSPDLISVNLDTDLRSRRRIHRYTPSPVKRMRTITATRAGITTCINSAESESDEMDSEVSEEAACGIV